MVEIPVKLGLETPVFPHRAPTPSQAWENPERDWRVVVGMEPGQDTTFSLGFQMQSQWWWELQAGVPVEGWVRFPCQQGQGRRRPPTVKKKLSSTDIGQNSFQRGGTALCTPCSFRAFSPTCCSCSISCRTLDELCSPLSAPSPKPV